MTAGAAAELPGPTGDRYGDVDWEQWLAVAIDRGWISFPACATHEGVPSTSWEQDRWEEGGDPCQVVVRVWVGAEDWNDDV